MMRKMPSQPLAATATESRSHNLSEIGSIDPHEDSRMHYKHRESSSALSTSRELVVLVPPEKLMISLGTASPPKRSVHFVEKDGLFF